MFTFIRFDAMVSVFALDDVARNNYNALCSILLSDEHYVFFFRSLC